LRHLSQHDFEYVLILSGDQLYQMDFQEMLQHHKESGADITVATIPVQQREASDFGILKVDENNMITAFIEKPKQELLPEWVSDTGPEMQKQGRNWLGSMGIYIFNRKLMFDQLLDEHKEAKDYGKEILPKSIGVHKIMSYQYTGYWTDIGNIYSFLKPTLRSPKKFRPSTCLIIQKPFIPAPACCRPPRSAALRLSAQSLPKAAL